MSPRGRGEGKTPHRALRIEDGPWDAFGQAAEAVGSDRSSIAREFIRWFIREPGAKLPRRPDPTDEQPTGTP